MWNSWSPRMQSLLSRARVDERQLLDAAAERAAAHLTAGQQEDDVVLIVDEKSSADCAGAARQYSAKQMLPRAL